MKNLLLAACVAAMSMWSPASHAQKSLETVRVQDIGGVGNLLARVAATQGFCEKHGLKCELKTVPGGAVGMQLLLSEDIDFQYGGGEVLLQAASRGAKIKYLGSTYNLPLYFMVAGNKTQLPSQAQGYPAIMKDLRGKRVGVSTRGSSQEYHLISLLKGAGMSTTDISVVAVGPADTALAAITNGQVDAMVVTEPIGAMCEVHGACRVVLDERKGQGPKDLVAMSQVAAGFAVRSEYAARKPETLRAMMRALKDAENFAQNPANLPAVLKSVESEFKMPGPKGEEVVRKATIALLPGFKLGGDPKALHLLADFLMEFGQLEKKVDYTTLLLQ